MKKSAVSCKNHGNSKIIKLFQPVMPQRQQKTLTVASIIQIFHENGNRVIRISSVHLSATLSSKAAYMKEKIKNVEEIKFKFNINIKKDRFDEPKRSSCLFRRHTDKRENAALRSRL